MSAETSQGPAVRVPPVPTGVATDLELGAVEVESEAQAQTEAQAQAQAQAQPEAARDEPGDATAPEMGSLGLILQVVKQNIRRLPHWLSRNAIWTGPLVVVWTAFHAIPDLTRMGLPGPLRSLTSLVIFLTGTYNGIVGKALYVISTNNVLVPLAKEIKAQGGFGAVRARLDKYARAIGVIRRGYASLGSGAIRMLLISGGTGFILANLLSRNNKADKYLVSLLGAVMLLNAASRGLGDPIVKLFRAIWRDVRRLSGKPLTGGIPVGQVFAAVAGVASGLAGSIVFHVVRFTDSFTDPTGYIVGAVCLIGGIAWSLSRGANENKAAE